MKKPLIKALSAELYIIGIVLFIQYGLASRDVPENVFVPIMMLSLFVLSVAVMGYLFFAEPLQLYLSGQRKPAISFFIKTVSAFAGITALIISGYIVIFL